MTTLENLREVIVTLDDSLSAENRLHFNIYMTREQILAVRKILNREILLDKEQNKQII